MSTPAQSRAEIHDLYIATQKLLGGTWKVGEQDWVKCTTKGGNQSGVSFGFVAQRLDQPIADPPALAKQVKALWAQHGFTATISEDKTVTPVNYYVSDPPFLSGAGPDGFLVQTSVSTNYADFSGHGQCVAGDLDTLNSSQ